MNQELKEYTVKCILCSTVQKCIYYQYKDCPELQNKPICEDCFYEKFGYPEGGEQ